MAKQPDFFIDRSLVESIPIKRVRWTAAYRLVPTRYPPIDLFERIADADDWGLLFELEGLTNPRLREQAGEISLVPPARRVSGTGASVVMAPFAHFSRSRPTRFADGTYGVYYAANQLETSLREVAFHMAIFYAATDDPPHDEDFRAYKGAVDGAFHDLRKGEWSRFLAPDLASYPLPNELAKQLRDAGSNGIVYPSVRHARGQCIAAFWPDVVKIPKQTKHIALKWDGTRISAWFDYEKEKWSKLK